jgi:choice-of-anchor B domain-containing protein
MFTLVLVLGAPTPAALTPCSGGSAAGYECDGLDMYVHMTKPDLGGGTANFNDLWGWTDPQTGKEYVLLGRTNGLVFVDISDPENPVYLGRLPTKLPYNASWRDVKVYQDHAFVVADFYFFSHGMQVFDLTRLRNVTTPVTFTEDHHYTQFSLAHNVAINEDSGFAYAVGTNTCSGGLHMIDISTPLSPQFAGCFSSDGYTHDVQCVDYQGPDTLYQGSEICFASNEDSLTIVDVSDKVTPQLLSKGFYPMDGYAHQGWLTPDQKYFILGDETDEQGFDLNTRTLIFDVTDLLNPQLIGEYYHATVTPDHNIYTLDNYVYQANYSGGLRVLDATNVAAGELTEVAYFDMDPGIDTRSFIGAWSVYPYFQSGVIAVSHIETGLFLLRGNFASADLALTTTADPDPAIMGQDFTYHVDMLNDGPGSSSGVVLTDTLDAGVDFVSATPSQGTCSESGGVVTCDLGAIGAGAGATVDIRVTSQTTGVLQNVAQVSADQADPDPQDNSVTTNTDSLDPALDQDTDGVSNGVDCAPLDPDAWAVPGAARDLRVEGSGPDDLRWQAPADPGGNLVRYDTLRSEDPSDFGGAVCVETDDTDLVATDATTPSSLFVYLVRAENACGGELGSDSAGNPRSGAGCP